MPSSTPSWPKQTASAAAGSASMAKVMLHCAATRAGVGACCAPRATSSAHLSADRFQMVTGKPPRSRFFAMALPMMPSPMKPNFCMKSSCEVLFLPFPVPSGCSKIVRSSHPQQGPRRRSTQTPGINSATPHKAACEDGGEMAVFQQPAKSPVGRPCTRHSPPTPPPWSGSPPLSGCRPAHGWSAFGGPAPGR